MRTELLPVKGRTGIFTGSLFEYAPGVLQRMGPALETGRSFVRAEYHRSYAPHLLLWKGIGHVVVRYPRYRYLFGAVSLRNTCQSASQQLLVRFLRRYHHDEHFTRLGHCVDGLIVVDPLRSDARECWKGTSRAGVRVVQFTLSQRRLYDLNAPPHR